MHFNLSPMTQRQKISLGILGGVCLLAFLTVSDKATYTEKLALENRLGIEKGICKSHEYRMSESDCKLYLQTLSQSNSNYLKDWIYQNTSDNWAFIISFYQTSYLPHTQIQYHKNLGEVVSGGSAGLGISLFGRIYLQTQS